VLLGEGIHGWNNGWDMWHEWGESANKVFERNQKVIKSSLTGWRQQCGERAAPGGGTSKNGGMVSSYYVITAVRCPIEDGHLFSPNSPKQLVPTPYQCVTGPLRQA